MLIINLISINLKMLISRSAFLFVHTFIIISISFHKKDICQSQCYTFSSKTSLAHTCRREYYTCNVYNISFRHKKSLNKKVYEKLDYSASSNFMCAHFMVRYSLCNNKLFIFLKTVSNILRDCYCKRDQRRRLYIFQT